jgi:hypothetical protein
LGSFTGMLMSVPSGRKNWSICSVMGISVEPVLAVNRKFSETIYRQFSEV